MTAVWEHTFRDVLRVQISEHPVLLTEAPLNPLTNRKQMAEVMFERFGVPAINVQIQAIMGLYATGRTTGVVLDVGDGVAHAVPVWDGYVVKVSDVLAFSLNSPRRLSVELTRSVFACVCVRVCGCLFTCLGMCSCLPQRGIGRINLGGRNLTEYLQRILSETGVSLNTSSQAEIVRDIKEKLGYVAYDFSSELEVSRSSAAGSTVPYTLPDGRLEFSCCVYECGGV
jgi:actin-related protein